MKKISFVLFVVALMLCFAGCGKGQVDAEESKSAYGSAKEIFDKIWENTEEDGRFPSFGGNQSEPIMDEPGTLDVTDSDMLSNMLLVPADIQDAVTDGASLIHMMNSNTFTGAVLKVEGVDVKEAADKVKDSVMGNHFMCGFPERLTVLTTGDYIFYAFGTDDIVTNFKTVAEAQIEGAEVVFDQLLEF